MKIYSEIEVDSMIIELNQKIIIPMWKVLNDFSNNKFCIILQNF
jgi:hypothetical protein